MYLFYVGLKLKDFWFPFIRGSSRLDQRIEEKKRDETIEVMEEMEAMDAAASPNSDSIRKYFEQRNGDGRDQLESIWMIS